MEKLLIAVVAGLLFETGDCKKFKKDIGLIQPIEGLSIWIDEDQVKIFSGITHMIIHVVANGIVMPYLLDRNLETHLPIVPPEIDEVRFRWRAGKRKYRYNFYKLQSHDRDLLLDPIIDTPRKGRIPKKEGAFSVRLPCTGNMTGIASFSIGLEILSRKKKLAGTPLKLRLRKECLARGEDPSCDRTCGGRGHCDSSSHCVCRPGWAGSQCSRAVCSPQCMNGGVCAAPGLCECPAGYQGRTCEGGICSEPCLNRGKCIQKDTCKCKGGFYGARCEFSKCVVPCLNGGQCKGVNRCRCTRGYQGNHCQILKGDSIQGESENVCEKDECRALKKCKNTHCNSYSKSSRKELRSCKSRYCGALLSCDSRSCRNKGSERRKRLKMLALRMPRKELMALRMTRNESMALRMGQGKMA